MDAATLFRIISLIPDRTAWAASGSAFAVEDKSERVVLIARLLHWLSPLEPLSLDNQQFLGLRSSGGRPAGALEDGALEEGELEDVDLAEEAPLPQPGAGTQIAA